MDKIKFQSGSASPFFNSLNNEVGKMLRRTGLLRKATALLYVKATFYILFFTAAYISLFVIEHVSFSTLALNYSLVGLSGILLAFNVSHDACHGSFSKNKKINYLVYHLTFNLQGTNAYLWQIRHNASHHVFPNVDGCDADIDDNPLLRLSPQHPLKKWQRYQHIYAIVVYSIYSLHWFLFKDFFYLFKKTVANLQHKKHPLKEIFLAFLWKLVYLSFLIVIPVMCGYELSEVLLAFGVMHLITSLFFIHVLIATHLCMETQFPQRDENGNLPGDYYRHQLATSLDYWPTSRFCNWFLGGFNAHAAHHLYPKLPHTTYPAISSLIEKKAGEFNVPYNKLGLGKAIISHYRFLKFMGSNHIKKMANDPVSDYPAQAKMNLIQSCKGR